MIHGVDFDSQLITAANMGHFMYTFSQKKSGISKGITASYSDLTITVQSGYLFTCGRMTEFSGTTTITAPTVTSGTTYCRLVYEVDLSKSNTETVFNQGTLKILQNNDAYPSLTQQNLDDNPSDGVYQLPLYKFTVTIDGIDNWTDERETINIGGVKQTSISLLTASWQGTTSPYYIDISSQITGETANTKVDLQCDATVVAQLVDDGTNALFVNNENGTLKAYAVGEKPSANLNVQATYYEVTSV